MRRLVVEIPLNEIAKSDGGQSPLQKVKSVEVLNFLRHDRNEFAVIAKVELADEASEVEDVLHNISGPHGTHAEIQVLEQRSGKTYTCFMKGRFHSNPPKFVMKSHEGYVTTPFELRDGILRLTFLGNVRETKALLKNFAEAGIHCRVVQLTDARFSPDSPISRLTDQQRRVLITAYKLGYYDRNRKVNTQRLAKQLKISSSTLVAHRRKAERRLIAELLDESQV